eukprot:360075-Chlamydomonas_euryale.AAC.2
MHEGCCRWALLLRISFGRSASCETLDDGCRQARIADGPDRLPRLDTLCVFSPTLPLVASPFLPRPQVPAPTAHGCWLCTDSRASGVPAPLLPSALQQHPLLVPAPCGQFPHPSCLELYDTTPCLCRQPAGGSRAPPALSSTTPPLACAGDLRVVPAPLLPSALRQHPLLVPAPCGWFPRPSCLELYGNTPCLCRRPAGGSSAPPALSSTTPPLACAGNLWVVPAPLLP